MALPDDQFILPDLYAVLPFKGGGQNPLFDVVSKESGDWIAGCGILPSSRHVEAISTHAGLFASYLYPTASYEALRVSTDFMNVLFILDKITDTQDPDGVRGTLGFLARALGNDLDCDDGSPITKMLISFMERLKKVASPNYQRRLYQAGIACKDAIQKEAEYRSIGKAVSLEDYHSIRRGNSGMHICFTLFELALGIGLPDEVVEHPAFKEIFVIGIDLFGWSNDLYSFNVEQSKGISAANIITILMEYKGYTLQQAVDHAGEAFAGLVQRFVEARQNFPGFGLEIDQAVNKYIDAIEMWTVRHLDWSFACKRYFGEASEEVKKTRIVKLYPRKSEA